MSKKTTYRPAPIAPAKWELNAMTGALLHLRGQMRDAARRAAREVERQTDAAWAQHRATR